MMDQLLRQKVRKAIEALPEPTRTILREHLAGAGYCDIALQHGLSTKGVEEEVARAIVLVDTALRQFRRNGS